MVDESLCYTYYAVISCRTHLAVKQTILIAVSTGLTRLAECTAFTLFCITFLTFSAVRHTSAPSFSSCGTGLAMHASAFPANISFFTRKTSVSAVIRLIRSWLTCAAVKRATGIAKFASITGKALWLSFFWLILSWSAWKTAGLVFLRLARALLAWLAFRLSFHILICSTFTWNAFRLTTFRLFRTCWTRLAFLLLSFVLIMSHWTRRTEDSSLNRTTAVDIQLFTALTFGYILDVGV